ncbi:MAG: hypothetical protein Hyperionvirus15_10 [Hyperionvirus sp.]|uniref:Uncharacterized protein n=1 Tax=Hyperionvirus sp. TaxID=2487770 RepID=A0A3G5AA74_9VIRU|nr:MAG: hypothetical protein Hyperionvirus15_10 [Hyperionvirus sp.]
MSSVNEPGMTMDDYAQGGDYEQQADDGQENLANVSRGSRGRYGGSAGRRPGGGGSGVNRNRNQVRRVNNRGRRNNYNRYRRYPGRYYNRRALPLGRYWWLYNYPSNWYNYPLLYPLPDANWYLRSDYPIVPNDILNRVPSLRVPIGASVVARDQDAVNATLSAGNEGGDNSYEGFDGAESADASWNGMLFLIIILVILFGLIYFKRDIKGQ